MLCGFLPYGPIMVSLLGSILIDAEDIVLVSDRDQPEGRSSSQIWFRNYPPWAQLTRRAVQTCSHWPLSCLEHNTSLPHILLMTTLIPTAALEFGGDGEPHWFWVAAKNDSSSDVKPGYHRMCGLDLFKRPTWQVAHWLCWPIDGTDSWILWAHGKNRYMELYSVNTSPLCLRRDMWLSQTRWRLAPKNSFVIF
jgi:hypothetical protein